jgi:hypothetical protein
MSLEPEFKQESKDIKKKNNFSDSIIEFANGFNENYWERRITLCNKVKGFLHGLPESVSESLMHTGKGISAGFFTGLALILFQFTSDENVNLMVRTEYHHFIEHYQNVPSLLINLSFFLISVSAVFMVRLGGIVRVIATPVLNGVSHTLAITSGMFALIFFMEIPTLAGNLDWRKFVGASGLLLLISITAVILGSAAYISKNGPKSILETPKSVPEKCERPSNSSNPTEFIIPLIALCLCFFTWDGLKKEADKFKEKKIAAAVAKNPEKTSEGQLPQNQEQHMEH